MATTLSRAQMEQVIREGGSVLHGGKILTKIEHLPSEADLAQGDPAAEARAADQLQRQIEQLQAQVARLQGEQKPAGDESEQQGEQAPAGKSATKKPA